MQWQNKLIGKLQEHSKLSRADIAAISALPVQIKKLAAQEDIVRQGDHPTLSVVVLEGMVGRYHTLKGGRRQYLSFHIEGDMPDAQALFLEIMDHSVCAIEPSVIATIPHKAIRTLFENKPHAGFAIWRETLIDAAIFREAVTNNSARDPYTRLAHFFCEQYYRADQMGLTENKACRLPLTQTQLAETLALSLPSISRALIALRKSKAVEFRNSRLEVKDWDRLVKIGDFNPGYLHMKKPAL